MHTNSLCTAFAVAVLAGCGQAGPARQPSPEPGALARTAEHAANDDATLRIEEFIQRQVPGVSIWRAGGNLMVQIRGVGTLGNASNALVVIDGVPQDSPNSLLNLSPTEIQKVEVLKDAAAGRYGVRGAMGVLVITLRRNS